MVKITTSWIIAFGLLFIIFLCLPLTTHAKDSTELQVMLSNKNIELGKPLYLTLTSRQTKISLDEINLTTLATHFHIKNISNTDTYPDHQQKRITLYPRNKGSFFIPALTFFNSTTETIPIEVVHAKDLKDNTPIGVTTSISTLAPWKKQQVLVKTEITTKASIVVFNTDNASSEHSDIVPLAISSQPITINNKEWTRHVLGWSIYPKQKGNHQLALPSINLVRDGVTTHRFYPPLLNLEVKALPIYIPSTMPVGRLNLSVTSKATSPIILNSLGNIKIKLSGDSANATNLPSLTSQLKSSKAISVYPAEISSQHRNTLQGTRIDTVYDVNFKMKQQGRHSFDDINLSYFDPVSGTIESRTKNIGSIYSFHPWLVNIMAILLLGLIAKLAYLLWQWGQHEWRSYINYKEALLKIRTANDSQTIKQCLSLIAKAENWPQNLTPRQWHSRSQTITAEFNLLALQQLEQMLYDNKEGDIESFKNKLIDICYQRQKPLKWLSVGQ